MRLLPRSRGRRIVAVVILGAVVLTSPLWWHWVVFGFKLAFPGPAYDAAKDRTSDAADLADADLAALVDIETAPRSAGTDPSITLERILDVEGPSAVADPPGAGPVYVSTLGGEVLTLDVATGDTARVLDLSDKISTGGERGLLGIAIDPEGERLYVDYTNHKGDNEIRSWPRDDLDGDGTLHLKIGQPFENHNGGNLVFGPDGALWIGTGDGGGAGDRGRVAQDVTSVLGKMLRVVPDPDGGVVAPTSNPTWTTVDDDARPEVWAIGLRNPWRYSFDRATNRLWIGDVGQSTIEEISVVDPNAADPDFGWSTVEGSNDYHGTPSPRFTDPVVEYTHDDGCSVTGGYVYRGDAIGSLYGWYLFADYCGGWIRAVPAHEPGLDPVELLTEVGSVISFAELESGELLVLTTEGISRVVG